MAILDLQGLETPQTVNRGKSGGSKGCVINGGGGGSRLSLLLC
ncbi:MAG: SapB/AmfS family lantipeptide [Solirubrobacterales bacterium]|nr:SapB/AmfS family lantipeptide [Solirubrobacterales bacterium]